MKPRTFWSFNPLRRLWKPSSASCRQHSRLYCPQPLALAATPKQHHHARAISRARWVRRRSGLILLNCPYVRRHATVSNCAQRASMISHSRVSVDSSIVNHDTWGPMDEYDKRVHSHQLRDDDHQRGSTSPPRSQSRVDADG